MVKGILIKGLVVASALAGLTLAPQPAAALDDGKGNSLLDVLDFVGLGQKKDDDVIFYRERAPLVLPPKAELRQPAPPASQRAANWPRDPEAVRAAKKAEENRKRSVVDDNADPNYAARLTREGRITAAEASERSGPGGPCNMVPDSPNPCSPTELWKTLAIKSNDQPKEGLQAGVEPEREYLTAPPKGYMKPAQNVKATMEAPKPESDDPFAYFRSGGK